MNKREDSTIRSDDEKADKRQRREEKPPDADGSEDDEKHGSEDDEKHGSEDDEERGSEDDEEQDSEGGAFSDSSNEETFSRARYSLEAILLRKGEDSEEDEGSEDSSSFDSEDSPYNEFAVRVSLINGACGQYFHAAEVKGNHRTGCDDCGAKPSFGYYAVDHSNGVYNAPKLCEECVRYRSSMLYEATEDMDDFKILKRMERQLRKKTFMLSPFVRQGLYESGPHEAFRIDRFSKELKTFEQHMASESLF
jgi:hypothetical protein